MSESPGPLRTLFWLMVIQLTVTIGIFAYFAYQTYLQNQVLLPR